MKRAVAFFIAAIFVAAPLLPAPRVVCRMRMPAAKMRPCCAVTTVRAPIKAVRVRPDVAPPPAAPRVHVPERSATFVAHVTARAKFWQPLATIQLRI